VTPAYKALLFGHVLSVVTWLGSSICMQVLSLRALRAGPTESLRFLGDVEWIGKRLLSPAGLFVVIFGILLVNEVGYGFSDTWIVLALTGVALAFLVVAGYLGPQSIRLSKLVGLRGPADPDVQARIRRIMLVSKIELVILIAVILDMVAKPGYHLPGTP